MANDPLYNPSELPLDEQNDNSWPRKLKAALGHTHLDRLTAREREVLELVAQGMSNKQIARALSITSHTAKAHVHSILHKLGFESRTEAAVLWTRHARNYEL